MANLERIGRQGAAAENAGKGRHHSGPRRARARLVRALWTLLPAGALAAACAESEPISIGDGGGGGATGVVDDAPPPPEQCGDGAISCDGGCCPPGSVCLSNGNCAPQTACSTNADCSSDSYCAAETSCVPWVLDTDGFNSACRQEVDLADVEPQVQCRWPGDTAPAYEPDSVQVIGTPMVVDFNFDNDPDTIHPSIVFISYAGVYSQENGVLRVIDGETCELQASIPGLFPFTPEVSPALGDINADGRPDIVVIDEEQVGAAPRSGVAAYEWSGSGTNFTQMWRTRSGATELIQGVALHDLDDDGIPEILTEGSIFNAQGRQMVTIPGGALEPPIVVDIDRELTAEIVTSEGIFMWDSLEEQLVVKPDIWDVNASVDGFFVALADMGEFRTRVNLGSDSVEMVVVGRNGEIWVKQIDGRTHLHVDPAGIAGGPPVIADFDGDGRVEFASPGRQFLTVFDMDCLDDDDFFNAEGCANGTGTANDDAILWQRPSQGANSGAAVFDFNGDGRVEVVYADQCYMRVYDGTNGTVLFSVPRSSTTQWEFPVVVDSDGDGHSEIVTASNDNDVTVVCDATDPLNRTTQFEATHGVTVWREKDDRWAGSRPVWNQHTYYASNVNDDGTIPSTFETPSHWDPLRGGHNTFRQNTQGKTGISLNEADLTASGRAGFQCYQGFDIATVSGDLCNRGMLPIPAEAANVALVRDDSLTTRLCETTNSSELSPGECVGFVCDVSVQRNQDPFDIRVVADSANALPECSESNNVAIISSVFCIDTVIR